MSRQTNQQTLTRPSDDIIADLKSTLAALLTLRDETRLKIHLGGMEVKQTWDALQPMLHDAEDIVKRSADSATEAALEAMRTTATQLEKLASTL